MLVIRSIWRWLAGDPNDGQYRENRRLGVWTYVRQGRFMKHLPWVYLLIGLYTFGYDAAHYPVPENTTYMATPNDIPGVKPAFAGVFWPLFWTWEIMAPADPTCL